MYFQALFIAVVLAFTVMSIRFFWNKGDIWLRRIIAYIGLLLAIVVMFIVITVISLQIHNFNEMNEQIVGHFKFDPKGSHYNNLDLSKYSEIILTVKSDHTFSLSAAIPLLNGVGGEWTVSF